MGQIYGIQNNIINKIVYIGQTTRNYLIRWQQHKQQSKERNYPLYQAFKKYGIQNFSPLLIEEVENEQLNIREQYWIQFYHTHIEDNGYNITLGGNTVSNKLKKPIFQYDLNGKYIRSFESINEAQWAIGKIPGSVINKAVNNLGETAYGYLWSFEQKDQIEPYHTNNKYHKRVIYQYDKNMNYINSYESVQKAAKILGKPPANISACALGKRNTAYGFIWRYQETGY